MSAPAPARPSATVLLVRDGSAGLEVFMVERHHEIEFAKGALVFPGGSVDAADHEPALRARCSGAAALDADSLALRVAAIRETFEESGVLLARPRGTPALLAAGRCRKLAERQRAELQAGRSTLAAIAAAEDLELACDLLVPFAHWITPEFMAKRFDTHFFLVEAPAEQVAGHDGLESVDSLWLTPAAALAEAKRGTRTLVFPTLLNLRKLGRSARVQQALANARSTPPVTVLPWVERRAGGAVLRIPAEAGYDVEDTPLAELGFGG